ncbi:MAG: hypothetical protein AAB731_04740 [Patescibacteria group bacterium]
MSPVKDMNIARQKLEELLDILPISPDEKDKLKRFLLPRNNNELLQVLRWLISKISWLAMAWRFKRPKGGGND